jgi:hypothetical protein
MNRRTFLGTLPAFCSLASFCQVFGNNTRQDQGRLVGPHFFEPTGLYGKNEILAFADVWDPEFQQNCRDKLTKFCGKNAVDKNRFTISSGPIPPWNLTATRLEREMDWVSYTRQLPEDAPGKERYVNFLLQRHQGDFGTINGLYGSLAKRKGDLLSYPFTKVSWHNATVFEDDSVFLRIIARTLSRGLIQIFGEQGLNSPPLTTNFVSYNPRQSRFANSSLFVL